MQNVHAMNRRPLEFAQLDRHQKEQLINQATLQIQGPDTVPIQKTDSSLLTSCKRKGKREQCQLTMQCEQRQHSRRQQSKQLLNEQIQLTAKTSVPKRLHQTMRALRVDHLYETNKGSVTNAWGRGRNYETKTLIKKHMSLCRILPHNTLTAIQSDCMKKMDLIQLFFKAMHVN